MRDRDDHCQKIRVKENNCRDVRRKLVRQSLILLIAQYLVTTFSQEDSKENNGKELIFDLLFSLDFYLIIKIYYKL